MKHQNPFTGPGPKEVHLPRAPLVKVLSQIRFPVITSIDKKEFIAVFQEEIRHDYPKLVRDQGIELNFGPQGGSCVNKVIWRMLDKNQKWRVSMGENFLSLETSVYPGRVKFLEALRYIVEKVQSTIQPDLVERIGLRYINRIGFNNSAHLSSLVHPGVLGIVHEDLEEQLVGSFSETRFTISDGLKVNGKWGLIPGHQTYDPTVLSPLEEQSWILDIDGFSENGIDFNAKDIMHTVNRLADIDYRLFRFTVTDTFLRDYGGEP